jgi:hypothetical protein
MAAAFFRLHRVIGEVEAGTATCQCEPLDPKRDKVSSSGGPDHSDEVKDID